MKGFLAFILFGILVGTLIGLTSESVVSGFLPILFAFGGGSIIGFMNKLNEKNRVVAFLSIAGISFGTLLGVYSAIYVTEHQILTPTELRQQTVNQETGGIMARKYLDDFLIEEIDAIDLQVRTELLTKAEAYDELKRFLREERE